MSNIKSFAKFVSALSGNKGESTQTRGRKPGSVSAPEKGDKIDQRHNALILESVCVGNSISVAEYNEKLATAPRTKDGAIKLSRESVVAKVFATFQVACEENFARRMAEYMTRKEKASAVTQPVVKITE